MGRLLSVLVLAAAFASCGDDDTGQAEGLGAPSASADPDSSDATSDGIYPDVVGAEATRGADGTWRFDVTVSSPYDSPQRYADAWRVLAPDGTELGVRELAHHHANQQPFTRSLEGVTIPEATETVTVQARDQRNGWGGATVELTLDR